MIWQLKKMCNLETVTNDTRKPAGLVKLSIIPLRQKVIVAHVKWFICRAMMSTNYKQMKTIRGNHDNKPVFG